MSSIANSLASQASSQTSSQPSTTGTSPDQLATENTFLKLLVAQIQNQDPTNPTDSTQFVGQLTQYSELEQLIGINQGVTKLNTQVNTANSTANNGANGATGA